MEVFAIGGVLVFIVLALVSSMLWFGFGIMQFVLVVHNKENTKNTALQQTMTSFTYLFLFEKKRVNIRTRYRSTSSMLQIVLIPMYVIRPKPMLYNKVI